MNACVHALPRTPSVSACHCHWPRQTDGRTKHASEQRRTANERTMNEWKRKEGKGRRNGGRTANEDRRRTTHHRETKGECRESYTSIPCCVTQDCNYVLYTSLWKVAERKLPYSQGATPTYKIQSHDGGTNSQIQKCIRKNSLSILNSQFHSISFNFRIPS